MLAAAVSTLALLYLSVWEWKPLLDVDIFESWPFKKRGNFNANCLILIPIALKVKKKELSNVYILPIIKVIDWMTSSCQCCINEPPHHTLCRATTLVPTLHHNVERNTES